MDSKVKVFVMVIFFSAIMQGTYGQSGSLGFYIGPSFSKPFVKNTLTQNQYSNYSDAVMGVSGQYQMTGKWNLLLDIGLCNRGMAVAQPVTLTNYDPVDGSTTYHDETNKYRYGFSYWDNQWLVRYVMGDKVKFYANAGLYYSVLLKTRKLIVDEYYDSYGTTGLTEVHAQYANHLNYDYRKSDVGFAMGVGIQKERFGLDYRYCLGISNVSKFKETISIHSSFSTVKLTFAFLQREKALLPHFHKNRSR